MTHHRKISSILLVLALASCATSAPPVPEDTTAVNRQSTLSANHFTPTDLAKSCEEIGAEQRANTAKIGEDNKAIADNRVQNQTAGYLGGLFIVPLVAIDSNSAEKDDITSLQARQDVLLQLKAFKNCPVQAAGN